LVKYKLMITKKERFTVQKQIILNYLQNTRTHPTAEKIYNEVKKKIPQISLSTVYRILKEFAKKKLIKEISFTESRFDSYTKPHPHFLCQSCQMLYDLNIKDQNKLLKKKLEIGKVFDFDLFYHGLCRNCLKKEKTKT
jgi:Fur family peroxide stress response transcriptional regulator